MDVGLAGQGLPHPASIDADVEAGLIRCGDQALEGQSLRHGSGTASDLLEGGRAQAIDDTIRIGPGGHAARSHFVMGRVGGAEAEADVAAIVRAARHDEGAA